ncbi:MAG TPA: bifunctional 4-hydroxy-2-oxoglutarate aldolase/2-dehydro-3-deoxy-phosphogluconate aldolase [Flavitalea sp.]|nr:bifunctional 4-hydroxy-2-oxoglutarate aldolase/2-dehydro-3-deoxy-phosphogluconate aldolase [Flavitalea sp.]
MNCLKEILHQKIVAILRGLAPIDVPPIVGALQRGGIRLVEITMNSDKALELIEQLSVKFSKTMLIGAGTVLDSKTAKAAIRAGAQFIISPSYDKEVIKTTRNKGAVSIPGAYTPTEIARAYSQGAHIVKVFPAGTPAYISNVHAPLDYIPLMPTGGVSIENIKAFQKAGGVAFGIGSSLLEKPVRVDDDYLQRLSLKAAQFVSMVRAHA